jgi:hypothetical protein
MDALRASLNAMSQRAPWYPGSEARCKAFLAKFPQVGFLGEWGGVGGSLGGGWGWGGSSLVGAGGRARA